MTVKAFAGEPEVLYVASTTPTTAVSA
jgi:hypothetical protein